METKARYVFLKTIYSEGNGEWLAVIADAETLGDDGVRSLSNAFKAHAAPLSRGGVHAMTKAQLMERLPTLIDQGMKLSADAFKQAVRIIDQKSGVVPATIEQKQKQVLS